MPFISKRAKLKMSIEEKNMLEKIVSSRSETVSRVERAKILLLYYKGKHISGIAKELHTNRPKIERCLNKAIELGIKTGLDDLPRSGKPAKISEEERIWLLSVACEKPKNLGYSLEFWSMSKLAEYIRKHCIKKGYKSLRKISKGTVSKILSQSNIKPHKVSYYTEKRDPDFETKMIQVLCVYKEVELYHKGELTDQLYAVLSYDEKPGIQAIGNIAPDLPPEPGKYTEWKRDKEYKRFGTVSFLAAIDLHTGKVHGQVFDRHRSQEFIEFLKYINRVYSDKIKIKVILDNHTAHISKLTRSYLKTVPNRFEFIFTPKHGSWLNLIEVFFSKMTRTFLKEIRVSSKKELKERIIKYLKEINKSPIIFHWKWKMDEIKVA